MKFTSKSELQCRITHNSIARKRVTILKVQKSPWRKKYKKVRRGKNFKKRIAMSPFMQLTARERVTILKV